MLKATMFSSNSKRERYKERDTFFILQTRTKPLLLQKCSPWNSNYEVTNKLAMCHQVQRGHHPHLADGWKHSLCNLCISLQTQKMLCGTEESTCWTLNSGDHSSNPNLGHKDKNKREKSALIRLRNFCCTIYVIGID